MSVVTRGFGPGATIAAIVLRGYGQEESVVSEATTGGWLSPEQVSRLRRIAEESERDHTKESRRKKQRVAKRLAELESIYNAINGLIPAEAVESVVEAVKPFAAASDSVVPPVQAVDWPALLASMEAVSALSAALLEASSARQEEELMILLMMTA